MNKKANTWLWIVIILILIAIGIYFGFFSGAEADLSNIPAPPPLPN